LVVFIEFKLMLKITHNIQFLYEQMFKWLETYWRCEARNARYWSRKNKKPFCQL